MKAGHYLLSLSLGLAWVPPVRAVDATEESNRSASSPAVRGRILELLQEDVRKIPVETKATSIPREDADSDTHNPSAAEGVLELEPLIITKKRAIVLPLIPKLTLENFFYGDGKIAQSANGRISLSAGPERKGLAALKINIRF